MRWDKIFKKSESGFFSKKTQKSSLIKKIKKKKKNIKKPKKTLDKYYEMRYYIQALV